MKPKNYWKLMTFLSNFIPNHKLRLRIQRKARYYLNRIKCNIGEHTYIATDYNIPGFVSIGKYCSIAREVKIGLGEHPINWLTTHTFPYTKDAGNEVFYTNLPQRDREKVLAPEPPQEINIGNDVWIGERAMILNGVTIGDGAVIGAGAVVTKDIPPYAVAAGVPARVVKYRFSEDIINKLTELKWWDYPETFVVNLPVNNIEECLNILEKNKKLKASEEK